MTARQVHAVIAAGLADPTLVSQWSGDPHALEAHGVDPANIDLAALGKFAGLSVKVRHNLLRDLLPLTFRLMNVAGLEIDVFAAYAIHRAPLGYAASTEERVRDLMSFLEEWLDRSDPTHALLWDVIRHEHALAELARTTIPVATRTSVPQIRGAILLHEMQCDPREAAAVLRQSRPQLDAIARGQRFFCYQREDDVRMIELDAFGYYALSFADGRTAAAISRALGLGKPTRAFRALLAQLADAGLVRLP